MSALFSTYNRFDLTVAEAEGTTITDTSGKKYLDFGSGIGVNNLGHRHPDVQKAVEEQLNKYWHVSNLYHLPIQEEVAQLLTAHSSGQYTFFCNSGAEANEAAIKLARKATGRTKVITFNQSFHGRTFATMAATGQEKIQEGFGPMLEQFDYVPFNDIQAIKSAIDQHTAAVMLEVIQGEGGVIPGKTNFINKVASLCKDHEVLLIVDEIQTGLGRTGMAFAYEHYGISPDIITVAKGLGNGLPVGAMIAKEELFEAFGPGSHGSTFGGNPLGMAAARSVLQIAFEDEFLAEVKRKGTYLLGKLRAEVGLLPVVSAIRGKGLMIGIDCEMDVLPVVQKLLKKGLLVLSAGPNVIRLLPPLTVSQSEMDRAVDMIDEVLSEAME